jgi:CTP synthase (UTP-ammonia lyase)
VRSATVIVSPAVHSQTASHGPRLVARVGRVGIRVALVGDRHEQYPSHREVDAVIPMLGESVHAEWVPTDGEQVRDLSGFDAVWLLPGSPYADDSAAYAAITYARTHGVPFLGTCGGLQYAVVEFFRNVLGVADASHAESDGPDGSNVVSVLSCSLFGEEREVRPLPGTRFAEIVTEPFIGMHYCNYGPSAAAVARLLEAGFVLGATAEDAEAEVLDLLGHPFFVLTLFQPQIGALAGKPLHPLLGELVRQARGFRR